MILFILILVVTGGISLWAMASLKSTYARYLKVPVRSGLNGAQTAAHILEKAGIYDVEIVQGESMLGDHYDPSHKRLVLSPDNYHGTSVAAVGVAAHECGHALQHQARYGALEMRMAAVGAVQFGQPVLLYGGMAVMIFFSAYLGTVLMAAGMGLLMLFQLITLPVEFDASARAKHVLADMGIIQGEQEIQGVNKVLNAAAMTYVAAFITALAWTLYYLLPLLLRR
ncbi:MAG: zinc metallopeptidase [Verrucomicrobiota bacterium]